MRDPEAEHKRCELLARDEGGEVIAMYANNVDALSSKGATPDKVASNREPDGWKSLERWWFA